jgi:hypothetical protein
MELLQSRGNVVEGTELPSESCAKGWVIKVRANVAVSSLEYQVWNPARNVRWIDIDGSCLNCPNNSIQTLSPTVLDHIDLEVILLGQILENASSVPSLAERTMEIKGLHESYAAIRMARSVTL